MTRWLLIGFATLIRAILSLRYQISVHGTISSKKTGVLFLVNHQSQIDTVFVGTVLGQRGIRFRPLIVEYVYQMAWLRPAIRKLRAIPIPNFETGVNEYKKVKGEEAMRAVSQALGRGENVLLYSSGKMKKSGVERIGGASAAYNLVQEHPQLPIILVRIAGLWGSRFSRALSDELPIAEKNIWEGIKAVLKNGIFFTPRRKLEVELKEAPESLYQAQSKLEFNRILEEWYNHYPGGLSEEALQLVPLSCWEQKENVASTASKDKLSHKTISPHTQEHVYGEIRRIAGEPNLKILPEKNLSTDLGLDSLDLAELSIFLIRHCKAHPSTVLEMETVQDALEIAEGRGERGARKFSTFTWAPESPRPPLFTSNAKNLPIALLSICRKMGSRAMCGDDRVGVLSYQKFARIVRVLAAQFERWPEKYIAVLLPASVGAYLVVFALQLARKVPVMLNWTLGPHYLEHMVQLSGVQRVLTSWTFIDRLQHVEFGTLIEKLQFLEDIRSSLSWKTKWRGLFGKFREEEIGEEEEAVLLFTSGSEAMPKGVPITYRNIMANFRGLGIAYPMNSEFIAYSTLPPFHSLGLVVTGLYTLTSGMRVAFYPDPTDSVALAEGIRRWKVTHAGFAPTFLRGLLNVAAPGDLDTMKAFMVGGEKVPLELFEQVRRDYPQIDLIEGYGVTECTPCVSLSISRPGAMRAMPGFEVAILHLETLEPVPQGTEGEICVAGPNVFKGYLGSTKSPFLEREGKRWYRTGDIGFFDADGSFFISGRLKRFVKLGGEMVSLGAIEEALKPEIHKLVQDLDRPVFAVCSEEKEDAKPRLILFTTVELSKEKANEILQKGGLSHLVRVDRVVHIPEIPLFASGKINYRELKS